MEKKPLAIIILGEQRCGKSSVWKALLNKNGYDIKIARSGKKNIIIWDDVPALKLEVYILSSSCSEYNEPIQKRIMGIMPEFLLVSEQTNGHERQNTEKFLRDHYQEIKIFEIKKTNSDKKLWEYMQNYDECKASGLSNARADEIVSFIKKYLEKFI